MTEQIERARLAYEAIMGRVSDSHWYRVKNLLKKHRLEISVRNVQLFAEIRKLIPRSGVKTRYVQKLSSTQFVEQTYLKKLN